MFKLVKIKEIIFEPQQIRINEGEEEKIRQACSYTH